MSELPDTMRAIVAPAPGGPETLEEREMPRPSPGPGEVLVRVAAAGVNPVDAKTRSGAGAARFLGDADWPWVPGWDLAGTVVGAGFRGFRTTARFELARETHECAAGLLGWLFDPHDMGALWHRVARRDGVLEAILPAFARRRRGARLA